MDKQRSEPLQINNTLKGFRKLEFGLYKLIKDILSLVTIKMSQLNVGNHFFSFLIVNTILVCQ